MSDISVIVASHNRASLVALCVECLRAQRYPRDRYDIVVVDDGSTDETPERLRPHAQSGAIRYVRLPTRMGSGPARNAGLEAAKGSIVIFVDSDAFAPPTFVAAHAAAHGASPGSVVDGPAINIAAPGGDRALPFGRPLVRAQAALGFFGQPFITVNASCRLDDIRRLGGFDAAFGARYGWEDTELFLRFRASGLRRIRSRAAWVLHAADAGRDLTVRGRRRFECGLNAAVLYERHRADETLRLLDVDALRWAERLTRLGLNATRVERWCLDAGAPRWRRTLLTPVYLRQQYARGLRAAGWPAPAGAAPESA